MNTSEILNILEQDPKIRPQLEGVLVVRGSVCVNKLHMQLMLRLLRNTYYNLEWLFWRKTPGC